MKKRYLSMALVFILIFTLAACKNKDKENDGGKDKGNIDYSEQLKKDIETYKQYVTLGEYKGIEVTIDKSKYEVKESDVSDYIDNIRKSRGEATDITSGVTKMGDDIRLDYRGTLDGVAFSGGTATDVKYTIGEGRFIKDLENGLIGLEVGKEYEIPCTFDESYMNSDLAGKDVIFTVTVSAIIDTVMPEYTDDFVKEIVATGAYDTKAQTTADFTKYVEDTLKHNAEQSMQSEKYSQIWNKINDSTKISGYPEEELKAVTETIKNNVNSEYEYYKSFYTDIDSFETFLKSIYNFSDVEEFNKYADEYAKNYMAEKMVITLIGERENTTISEDDIKEFGELIAKQNGYASYEEIIEKLGEEAKLEVGYSALADKVSDILLSNAVEK